MNYTNDEYYEDQDYNEVEEVELVNTQPKNNFIKKNINDMPNSVRNKLGLEKIINPLVMDYVKENTSLVEEKKSVINNVDDHKSIMNENNNDDDFGNNDDYDDDDFEEPIPNIPDTLPTSNNSGNSSNSNNVPFSLNKDTPDGTFNNPWTGGNEDEEEEEETEQLTREKIKKLKLEYLAKIHRIEKSNGYKAYKVFSMSDDLEDIKSEYERLKDQVDMQKAVSYGKSVTVGIASVVEILNTTYDPFDIKLKGWSENLKETLEDHDDVFVELYEKYKDVIQVSPELKLLGIVFFSGMSFHFSAKVMDNMFKKAPDHHEIINSNPELKRLFDIEVEKKRINEMNKTKGGNVLNQLFNTISGGTKTTIKPVSSVPQEFKTKSPSIGVQNFTSSRVNAPQNESNIPFINDNIKSPEGVDDIMQMFEDDTTSKSSKIKTLNLDSDVESINDKQTKSTIKRINLNFKKK